MRAAKKPIVEMRNIAKTFGSTRALRGVDFTVIKGEVHALLGRNGAGKSTLVSALSGFTPADSGTITIAGTTIIANGQNYAATIKHVMGHVQQTPRLFDLLSVAENSSSRTRSSAIVLALSATAEDARTGKEPARRMEDGHPPHGHGRRTRRWDRGNCWKS